MVVVKVHGNLPLAGCLKLGTTFAVLQPHDIALEKDIEDKVQLRVPLLAASIEDRLPFEVVPPVDLLVADITINHFDLFNRTCRIIFSHPGLFLLYFGVNPGLLLSIAANNSSVAVAKGLNLTICVKLLIVAGHTDLFIVSVETNDTEESLAILGEGRIFKPTRLTILTVNDVALHLIVPVHTTALAVMDEVAIQSGHCNHVEHPCAMVDATLLT